MKTKKLSQGQIRLGRKLSHWLSVIVIGITLGLGLQFVRAWTEPTVAPPGGNVGAPINTSATAQTKQGGFNILGFLGIGTNSPTKQIDAVGEIKSRTGFCINNSCISAWPTAGTPTPTPIQTYRCPDYLSYNGGFTGTCAGQVQINPTCLLCTSEAGCNTGVACTPI